MTDLDFRNVTLGQLIDADVGICLRSSLLPPIGMDHSYIPLSEVGAYLSSPKKWLAKQCGGDAVDYDEWQSQSFTPRCAGITKAGKPCKNGLAGMVDLKEFIAMHREGYCSAHG